MPRIALILFLAAASASAQIPSIAIQSCPINLFAERQSGLTLERATDAAKTGPSQSLHVTSQSLHVTVSRTDTPEIVSLEATLHGLSPEAQIVPAAAKTPGDIAKTFHLERKPGEPTLTAFTLRMSRAGVLRWVDVTSITYADGTTWNSPQPSLCRAIPSPFLLVAGR